MAEAKIVVCASCWFSMTPLEALANNKPAILIQWRELVKIKPEASAAVRALEKAGVLYDNPLDAAHKLNAVYDDVDGWWNSSEVQNARTLFVETLIPAVDDWEQKWLRALQRMGRDCALKPASKHDGHSGIYTHS
jgi:putative transferase (TIGR04331 family)